MIPEMRESTARDFACALSMEHWERMRRGDFRGGDDIRALRRFIRMSQRGFAEAMTRWRSPCESGFCNTPMLWNSE